MKIIIMPFILLSLLITSCTLAPKSNYAQPCNDKYHGVLIGDRCFDCGADDGLCPEDFSDKPVCTSIPDVDC